MHFLFPTLSIFILFSSLYCSQKTTVAWQKFLAHIFFIATSVLLLGHFIADFPNQKVLDGVRFALDSAPFTLYINFDKPFIALAIFLILGLGDRRFHIGEILKTSFTALFLCSLTLLLLALAVAYVRFDPKLPSQTWIWAANNLFLVAASEEAFFRRYLQTGLSKIFSAKFRWGEYYGLLVAALLFGLWHYKGGLIYVFFATVAGIFYGWAYSKTKRVEAAILTHFLFNSIHFLCFSYPSLIQ